MALPEQKKKLLKAKIAVALQSELGRVPMSVSAIDCSRIPAAIVSLETLQTIALLEADCSEMLLSG